MYRDISEINRSLQSIARSLEKIANPVIIIPPDFDPEKVKAQFMANSHEPGCTGCAC